MTPPDGCGGPPGDGRCRYSDEAARSAVKQVFAILGVDVDDPKAVEEFREDLRFGRAMRQANDKGRLAVAALIFCALAMALWAGITSKIGGH